MISARLFTKVKQQWAALVLGCVRFSAFPVSLMALRLVLVDQTPFSLVCSESLMIFWFFTSSVSHGVKNGFLRLWSTVIQCYFKGS